MTAQPTFHPIHKHHNSNHSISAPDLESTSLLPATDALPRRTASGMAHSQLRRAFNAVRAAQKVVTGPRRGSLPLAAAAAGLVPPPPCESRYRWNHSHEPGVDPSQPQPHLDHLRNIPVAVDVIDYCEDRVEFQVFQTPVDIQSLEQAVARRPITGASPAGPETGETRPTWSSVRWININGLSWEVIRMMALHYDLHPLAVEDCLHTRSRSKSEYYKQHLFLHVAVHTLANTTKAGAPRRDLSRAAEPTHHRNMMDLSAVTSPNSKIEKEVLDPEREEVMRLTKDYTVTVHVEKLSMFLLRDGTVITVFSHDGSGAVLPIIERLKSADTLLRSSSDGSMLLQALLDIIVDQGLDVVEAYRSKLTSLESRVLVKPDLDTVRHLHVLTGELLLLKRTFSPILSLVHGILSHDSPSFGSQHLCPMLDGHLRSFTGEFVPRSNVDCKSAPQHFHSFISPQAKIYLSDVVDHIESVLSSLELFSDLSSNLVDFTFNTMSFSTNESMKQLTMITIFFLPLTFLTGYFGMNFTDFPLIQGRDLRFWYLALPITLCLVILALLEKFKPRLCQMRLKWSSKRTLGQPP